MKNLEKEYDVHRYDIKTSEKKIFKKYTDTIRSHEYFDIRLNDDNSDEVLSVKEYSIEKIFSLLNEYPEEHILFLYLIENKNPPSISIPVSEPSSSSSFVVNQLNSSEIRLDSFESESPPSSQENTPEYKISQYFCIFSLIYYIMAGLITIHFLQFLCSKQVRKYNKFIIYSCNI